MEINSFLNEKILCPILESTFITPPLNLLSKKNDSFTFSYSLIEE